MWFPLSVNVTKVACSVWNQILVVKMSVILLHCSQNKIFKCIMFSFHFSSYPEFQNWTFLQTFTHGWDKHKRVTCTVVVKVSDVQHRKDFTRYPYKCSWWKIMLCVFQILGPLPHSKSWMFLKIPLIYWATSSRKPHWEAVVSCWIEKRQFWGSKSDVLLCLTTQTVNSSLVKHLQYTLLI